MVALAAVAVPSAASGATPSSVVSGGSHTCAIVDGGSIRCWGYGSSGELGDGAFTYSDGISRSFASAVPVRVQGIADARSLALGGGHSCALLASGSIKCWGANRSGQLGRGQAGDSFVPVPVSGITNATAIAAGGNHTCALLAGGTIKCWGSGDYGMLGTGQASWGASSVPVDVTGIADAVAIATGTRYTCALLSGGSVKCWGNNDYGQLGSGDLTFWTSTPTTVPGINGGATIGAGDTHTCVALVGGAVKCWGRNQSGQLGVAPNSGGTTPVTVPGVNNAGAIALGGAHTCAVLAVGTTMCWGADQFGQLGNGRTAMTGAPEAVPGVSGVVSLSAGTGFSCAVLSGPPNLKCWGQDNAGQLGNANTTTRRLPAVIPALTGVSAISSSTRNTCALVGRSVKCWGDGTSGQLGNGELVTARTAPVDVQGIDSAIGVSTGAGHSCAVMLSGAVQCWGDGTFAELGNGVAGRTSATPVDVQGVSTATAVAAGDYFTCALLSSGVVECWGTGSSGQLGNGQMTGSSSPVRVDGIATAAAVSARGAYACALLTVGTVKCWGDNASGTLGNGQVTASGTPVDVQGVTSAVALSLGNYHACVLLSGGGVKCWGTGDSGQLGSGQSSSSGVPVSVQDLSTATSVSVGSYHSCASLQGGAIKCWGRFSSGQWGSGDTGGLAVGIGSATSVAAGGFHTCALLADRTVSCWGDGSSGALGDGLFGTVAFRVLPDEVVGMTPEGPKSQPADPQAIASGPPPAPPANEPKRQGSAGVSVRLVLRALPRALRARRGVVRVRCDAVAGTVERCAASLRHGRRTLGVGRGVGTGPIALRLSAWARRQLVRQRRSSVNAVLSVTATGPGGVVTRRRSVLVRG